jgi:hypothetical protein
MSRASASPFSIREAQPELGDCPGRSSAHVNRVFQELRRDGLIASRSRFIRILNWAGLQRAADFDATYLHLAQGAP